MPNIRILPPNIANKIAAGEVVDRPASVVKELVENAIDAEATEIKVVISHAGKEMIQVVDNGNGMSEEDAILAFERHATSKIKDIHDLDHILTLGFRGEALASIASVSRMELKTRLKDDQAGTSIKIDGGKIAQKDKAALEHGTVVTVKNLFYNTPARRNFLRADTTEMNHILKVLKRFFLSISILLCSITTKKFSISPLEQ
jgi:DNA mismatch repair protein MutL